jgi:hypothetical protein
MFSLPNWVFGNDSISIDGTSCECDAKVRVVAVITPLLYLTLTWLRLRLSDMALAQAVAIGESFPGHEKNGSYRWPSKRYP